MKRCPRCGETKPLSEFHRTYNTKTGRVSYCKPCLADRRRDRYQNEPGYRERENEKQRARHAANPRLTKDRTLRKKFNLTIEQYDALLAAQGGRCFICQRKPAKDRALAVDHNHVTGRVRGLLCPSQCNYRLLGAFHEDADLFERAAEYLRNPPCLALGLEVYVPNAPPPEQPRQRPIEFGGAVIPDIAGRDIGRKR